MRIVAGEWGGRRIEAPKGRDTRPTTDRVREAWMAALQDEIPGARVLDLFAGSGALGLEALSRGAAHATFVENAPDALRTLNANISTLGADERARVVRTDALRYAASLDLGAFDVALADPPYGRDLAALLVRRWTERPFAALLCVEHRVDDPLPEVPGARDRRYGDTVITFLSADT
jgi:16S rRNA (guanine966-N2)-methyltransferase